MDGIGARSLRLAAAAASAALLAGATAAEAQLTPERLYYGINRAMPMTVEVPQGAQGDARVLLFAPGSSEPAETASVSAGRVDLAAMFPVLWTASDPKLYYAQLEVGGTQVGPPVVLQPMRMPIRASLQGRQAVFPPSIPNRPYSGIRAYVEKHVVLETTQGEIEIRLRPDEAPNTAWNFRHLVEGGFYTDIIFHRIVPEVRGNPFVIQVGDPTGTGSGGPGYMVDLEPSDLEHDFGVLSMARSQDPDSNGSQVFLCLSRAGTEFLDTQYTAFGQTVRGAEVIKAISAVPVGAGDRPVDPAPKINSARLVDAPPVSERPEPVKDPAVSGSR